MASYRNWYSKDFLHHQQKHWDSFLPRWRPDLQVLGLYCWRIRGGGHLQVIKHRRHTELRPVHAHTLDQPQLSHGKEVTNGQGRLFAEALLQCVTASNPDQTAPSQPFWGPWGYLAVSGHNLGHRVLFFLDVAQGISQTHSWPAECHAANRYHVVPQLLPHYSQCVRCGEACER